MKRWQLIEFVKYRFNAYKLGKYAPSKKNADPLGKATVDAFVNEFQTTYLPKLNATAINTLMQRQQQFVGDRCLALSIKFLEMSMS